MQSRTDIIIGNINGKILDVGFTCGTLHEKLIEKFSRENIFGIDIEVKNKNEFDVEGSAEDLPFNDNFFDSIVAGELTEHLNNPDLFVKESQRVLKKGGKLILTTPNRDSLINRLFKSYHAPAHLSLFNFSELKKLLEKNGFVIDFYCCFPYTSESNYGSKFSFFFPFRNLIHFLLPKSLQENMVLVCTKN